MADKVTVGHHTIEISNPDKVLFPDDGITKADLVGYYLEVAGTMLPHVRGRPVTMQRYPDGLEGEGFIQKEIGDYFPDWVPRVTVKKEGGQVTQTVIDNAATLAYLANQACITPHVWLSREDRLDNPDRMIFDLDPPDGAFGPVRDAARALRALLEEVGLPAYVQTTGSRGLHLAVPLARREDFDTVRDFARDLAAVMARRDRRRLTTAPRKEKRHGRLFIDTARNAYAQTAVAPYAVRAKPGAPVATPVRWEEIGDGDFHPQKYTLKNILRRLGQTGDAWAEISRHAHSLLEPRRRLDVLMADELTRTPGRT